MDGRDFLTAANRSRLESMFESKTSAMLEPRQFNPLLFSPATLRLLLVADGFIFFSDEDFGLSDFLAALAEPVNSFVRYEVTAAHRGNVADVQLGVGNPNIARTIRNFRFDNAAHFDQGSFDEVWLLGSDTTSLQGASWVNKPADSELRKLSEFMEGGGGVFATGDHGALGAALSGFVPRVRSMRLWFAEPGPNGEPVAPGMTDSMRNDTNQPGPGAGPSSALFNDQSDDIPQPIQLKRYGLNLPFLKITYPHPLFCGPGGPIAVLPDHPHEGSCVYPYEIDREFDLDGYHVVEYPSQGTRRPLPELIATSRVLAGNTASGKDPTLPHEFGAAAVYDGEAAGVGRVAVDATWHHFININLTGEGRPDPAVPKSLGFLASAAGQAHYEQIKSYFRNIAIWLAPPSVRTRMRRAALWSAVWDHRILEAVTPGIPLRLSEASRRQTLDVGIHARDALDRIAGQCLSIIWMLDIVRPLISSDLFEQLDPWPPAERRPQEGEELPLLDLQPLLDIALGGAVIAIREEFPNGNEVDSDFAEGRALDLIQEGASRALRECIEAILGNSRVLGLIGDAVGGR